MKTYSLKSMLIVVVTLCIALTAASAMAWNFTIQAAEVKPQNGKFTFPLSQVKDGQAHHFVYKHSPSEWVRFFVLTSDDGVTRAAFDACDVCYRSKKGYVQQGNNMVCINCGLKFRSNRINEVKGGCNPAPLKRAVNGENLVITLNDVLAGHKYFR
jgi:uncharacterized membrane protein